MIINNDAEKSCIYTLEENKFNFEKNFLWSLFWHFPVLNFFLFQISQHSNLSLYPLKIYRPGSNLFFHFFLYVYIVRCINFGFLFNHFCMKFSWLFRFCFRIDIILCYCM